MSRPSAGMSVTLSTKLGELLLLRQAEFMRLFDRSVEVAAGVGEGDDVGAGGLRLQQEAREVGRC